MMEPWLYPYDEEVAQGDTARTQKSERQHRFRLDVVCVVFVLLFVLFPFSRSSPASSKACFTKVVSSLSGQRCAVRYLLRSSDFCCVRILKQAHTRFELAYQRASCVYTLPLATAQTGFLPSGLLFYGGLCFSALLGTRWRR